MQYVIIIYDGYIKSNVFFSERLIKLAVIKAFKGMRFTEQAGDIAEVVCPPYDIIPEEQTLELIKRNEYNAFLLVLPVHF